MGEGKSDGKKNGGQIVPLAVGMPLRFLTLAPGPQRVAVVVVDEISGVQSTVFAELEIPTAK